MIVVGTSHRGTLGRVWAGSATEQVLHGAPAAVAVAPVDYAQRPEADRALRRVGVAYDGSPEAKAALVSRRSRWREPAGARVVPVSIVDLRTPTTIAYGYEQYVDAVRELATLELKEAGATVRAQRRRRVDQARGRPGDRAGARQRRRRPAGDGLARLRAAQARAAGLGHDAPGARGRGSAAAAPALGGRRRARRSGSYSSAPLPARALSSAARRATARGRSRSCRGAAAWGRRRGGRRRACASPTARGGSVPHGGRGAAAPARSPSVEACSADGRVSRAMAAILVG